jgi:ADP-ribosyl-[dinitrogen reductase] hydrolase
VTGGIWLRGELISSRLAPDETLPDAIRWIDLDEALLRAGGTLTPGGITLAPDFVGTLWRWRLAGLRPLVATCTIDTGADVDAARTAAQEIDVLTGGALDAIRIAASGLVASSSAGGREKDASPRAATSGGRGAPDGVHSDPGTDRDDAARRGAGATKPAPGPAPPSAPTADKLRGALLGLAVGDALGAPVENWPAEKIARIHGPFRDYVSGRGWGPGHPTRETTLALLWFREFADGRTVHTADDRARLGQALARWALGRPRDFGHLTRGILSDYLEQSPVVAARAAWERAHRRPEFNAALSRAAAVGIALSRDDDLRRASAIAASAMTHPAPVDLGCAVAVADGIAAALRGADPLEAARSTAWNDRVSAALDSVAGGWIPGGPEWSGHERGHSLHTLRSAFWASQQEAGLEEVLLDLVHRGGDADTHAAVAGAILGARQGPASIPERWLGPLRVREVVEDQIGRFMESANKG